MITIIVVSITSLIILLIFLSIDYGKNNQKEEQIIKEICIRFFNDGVEYKKNVLIRDKLLNNLIPQSKKAMNLVTGQHIKRHWMDQKNMIFQNQ